MHRTRNEERWNTEFHHYTSLEDFLGSPVQPGGITYQHQGYDIDILYEPRGSATTLVVFNAAVAFTHEHTPIFTGQTLARQTGTNLIAISDPLLRYQDISTAWYLGDQHTGPLRPVLTPAIHHVLNTAGSTRTILFGASGGGYAAGHCAHDFPDSIALLINPRLSLKRANGLHMPLYLAHGHNTIHNDLTDQHRKLLEPYGPLDLETAAQAGLNHDLLIYQNLLDARFIENQLIPFLDTAGEDPRLHLRFSNDGPDHARIPFQTLKQMIIELTQHADQKQAIQAVGFGNPTSANAQALRMLPTIGHDYIQLTKDVRAHNDRVDELEKTTKTLTDDIQQRQHKIARLQREPKLTHRLWRILPYQWRQRIKQAVRRT